MLTPRRSVTCAVAAIIQPVSLSQRRLVEWAAPGREMRKVTKIRTALTITPVAYISECELLYDGPVTCEGCLH